MCQIKYYGICEVGFRHVCNVYMHIVIKHLLAFSTKTNYINFHNSY